jgi:hypothetical protein
VTMMAWQPRGKISLSALRKRVCTR